MNMLEIISKHNLKKKVDELGVEVLTGTKAVDLILDEDGAKGALVEDKTTKYAINSEATIIATGGFAMVDLR